MQVVEVRMGDKNEIDGGKVGDPDTGAAKALENEDPRSVIRIDDDVFAAYLDEEAGMSNEGDTKFVGLGLDRLVGDASARGHGGMPNKLSELFSFLAKSDLQHERMKCIY